MKSLANQSPAERGGEGSVLTRQRRDHVKLNELLQRLSSLPASEQQPVLLEVFRLVFPHAFAEESVLWPLLRRLSPEGPELTLKVEREHQTINELATKLEALDPTATERQPVLEEFMALLLQDVRDEEDELLPRLQRELGARKLRLLGLAWDTVRRVAPTRAHPLVARRPPGNVLAALPLSIIDRSRDRLDGVLLRGGGPVAEPLRLLGSALARASDLVERLPGLRSGEDPATRKDPGFRLSWTTVGVASVGAASIMLIAARRRRRAAVSSTAPGQTARRQGATAAQDGPAQAA